VKRLLFALCLAGAAVYVLTPPRAVPDREAEDNSAAQTQANHPMSSWGSSLQSLRRTPQVPLANSEEGASPRQSAAHGPRRYGENQDSERTPVAHDPAASVVIASAPAIDAAEQEPIEWAKVIFAARVHSEASVSAPVIRFYRPGTELQVVRRESGWLQLLDPVTQERGWVFEKYLVSLDGPSPTQAVMESITESPRARVASPKSQKPSRSSKLAVRLPDKVEVAKSEQRRGFGLFRFFRGREVGAAAWSIGSTR
jgi:Bacterial SH3 domain